MIYTHNTNVAKIKQHYNFLRRNINNISLLLIGLSIAYIIYWVGVKSDALLLDYTEHIFKPLASFFFPAETSLDIYKNTAGMFLSLVVPMGIAYYIVNKLEEVAIDNLYKKQEKKEAKAKQQDFLDSLKQYEDIKTYSLCLSIDYDSKKELSEQNKTVLNKSIFSKIKETLNSRLGNIYINSSDVLIVASDKFDKYDKIYETILITLSEIKSKLEKNYNFKIIPSITTDAYTTSATMENIKSNHYNIKSFNFKNRACTTETFRKKYNYLHQYKYKGIPIGEYITSDKYQNSYELNIIHKDLSKTLASIS